MVEFEELRLLWKPYEELKNPPAEKIRLWSAGGCGIWISDEWGPAVPYPAVDHGNGNLNHGYRRLKGIGGAVSLIPEARDWPELQKFLETVNAESSPIESVGCEKAFFTDEKNTPPIYLPIYLGSYTDVVFTEAALNDRPENLLLLASRLANAVEGCDRWWATVSLVLQREKILPGAVAPWGLMIHVTNHGRTEDEARKFWGETLLRLGKSVAELPRDFRFVE
jgi:hypothetical protein